MSAGTMTQPVVSLWYCQWRVYLIIGTFSITQIPDITDISIY